MPFQRYWTLTQLFFLRRTVCCGAHWERIVVALLVSIRGTFCVCVWGGGGGGVGSGWGEGETGKTKHLPDAHSYLGLLLI